MSVPTIRCSGSFRSTSSSSTVALRPTYGARSFSNRIAQPSFNQQSAVFSINKTAAFLNPVATSSKFSVIQTRGISKVAARRKKEQEEREHSIKGPPSMARYFAELKALPPDATIKQVLTAVWSSDTIPTAKVLTDEEKKQELAYPGRWWASSYGELLPDGVRNLCAKIDLTSDDVFYDMGSGHGKMLIQIALETPTKKCVGIDLAPSRLKVANDILDLLKERNTPGAEKISYLHSCIQYGTNWKDATILYACSTCFPDKLLDEIARQAVELPAIRYIILHKYSNYQNTNLQMMEKFSAPTSWDRCAQLTKYVVKRPGQPLPEPPVITSGGAAPSAATGVPGEAIPSSTPQQQAAAAAAFAAAKEKAAKEKAAAAAAAAGTPAAEK